MEQPQKPQRSPWFYVLLGCLGLAGVLALFCLVAGLWGVKKGADVAKGFTDPKTRQENAVRMLGAIPEGYTPIVTLSMLGMMDLCVLGDAPLQEDGGMANVTRTFAYFRVMANENAKKTRDFFQKGEGTDASALRQSGVNVDVHDIVKRGNLVVDGRKIYYVVARGTLDTGSGQGGATEGLQTSMMFDCPGDDLRIGVWMMKDPSPTTPAALLDLTDTVADEAKLAAFLKPIDPCGK